MFKKAPSKLDRIYGTHSLADLQRVVSLRIQYEYMRVVQERDTLREVIQEALGSETVAGDKPPETFDDFAALIGSAGGMVHG